MFSVLTQQRRGVANKFGYYSHDVHVAYPPKDRSKVWSLPEHRKLVIVANGHINEHSKKQPNQSPPKVPVTAVVFAKCNTFKMIHNFTKEEFEFLISQKDQIRSLFEAQAKMKDDLEAQDRARKHVCK